MNYISKNVILKIEKVVKNYFFNLFLFVTIGTSPLFTLVRRYLMSFSFFTARHKNTL